MKIIIVGAGIAGLATALALAKARHHVTVLESAHALAEIGAGVQLTPNTTKWLWRWGCGPDILAISALPESFNVINGIDGKGLGSVDFSKFETEHGGPYLVIHRADIHRILHDHAVKAGAEVKLNSRVEEYFPDEGRIVLVNRSSMTADLIVAVDGIHSHARQFLLGSDAPQGDLGNNLEKSGWAAYRLMAEVSQLKDNEATRALATSHKCNCVVGNGCSVMTYMVKGTDKLNLVLSHRDDVETTHWTQEQYREAVRNLFKGFGQGVQSLLNTALSNPDYQITNWPVHQVTTLPRWRSDSGRLVLMGDATHAMPYFLSMGVSMAAEDAAALCECLQLMNESNGRVTLSESMKLFEDVRKERAEVVRNASLHAGQVLHTPEGEERLTRDALLHNNGGNSYYHKNMNISEIRELVSGWRYGIIDNTMRDWLYGYDVVEDVQNVWAETYGK